MFGLVRFWHVPGRAETEASRAESQSLDDGPSEAWSRPWRSAYQPQEGRQLRPAVGWPTLLCAGSRKNI